MRKNVSKNSKGKISPRRNQDFLDLDEKMIKFSGIEDEIENISQEFKPSLKFPEISQEKREFKFLKNSRDLNKSTLHSKRINEESSTIRSEILEQTPANESMYSKSKNPKPIIEEILLKRKSALAKRGTFKRGEDILEKARKLEECTKKHCLNMTNPSGETPSGLKHTRNHEHSDLRYEADVMNKPRYYEYMEIYEHNNRTRKSRSVTPSKLNRNNAINGINAINGKRERNIGVNNNNGNNAQQKRNLMNNYGKWYLNVNDFYRKIPSIKYHTPNYNHNYHIPNLYH